MSIAWGYVRVSTDDQGVGLAAQRTAILGAGVDARHMRVDEGISGTRFDRPALVQLMGEMQKGDTLVVAKLDRLGRSIYGVLGLFKDLEKLGVEVKVLHEQIDTTTPSGKLLRGVLLLIAEFERDMISSRTKYALAEIKRTGIGKSGLPVKVGRRRSLTEQQEAEVVAAVEAGAMPAKLARQYSVSRATIYNVVGKHQKCIETASVV